MGREARLDRTSLRAAILPVLAVAALGLSVRLLVVPAVSEHVYDGHEAEYWDLFAGTRRPTQGGTVLYPAMQWLWYGLGRVLPAQAALPVLIMASFGVGAAALLGVTAATLADRRAGMLVGLLALLHPAQAAWSSSAYNVILPHFFGCLCICAAARLSRSHRPSLALGALGALSFTLAVATRLDSALMGVPALLLLLFERPPGRSWGAALRGRMVLVPPALFSIVLAARAAWPLVFPGEVPGAGERWLSFCINVRLLDYYAPLDGWLGVLLVLLGAASAARRWPVATAVLVLGAALNHLLLATFDDFGERHALSALPGLLWCLGAGAVAAPRWLSGGLGLASTLHLLVGLADLRGRYYGTEEAYTELLAHSPWSALPRWSAEEAKVEDGSPCGWINEDPRVSEAPLRSHFNLVDPVEAESLRGPTSCLRLCMDVQDWRWSSRAVRDRALRVSHLYRLRPIAVVEEVVEEGASGYSCLVFDLGERTCCETTPASSAPASAGTGGHVGGAHDRGRVADPSLP